MRKAILVATALALVAATVGPPAGVAVASPAKSPPGPAAHGSGPQIYQELTSHSDGVVHNSAAAPQAVPSTAAAADDRAVLLHRQQYLDKIARGPVKQPQVTPHVQVMPSAIGVVECYQDDFSYRDGGFVIDHYNYCESRTYTDTIKVCETRIPVLGCIRGRTVGNVSWRVTTKGYGWDGSMTTPQNPDPTKNQISFVTLLDDFRPSNAAIEALNIRIDLECQAAGTTPNALCLAEPGETSTSRTVAQWMTDGGTFFRYLADPADGVGRDRVSWFDFKLKTTTSWPTTNDETAETFGSQYRCDNASYLVGRRGCMFDDVAEEFPVSLSPTAPYRKAALHIFDAFYQPQKTQPQVPDKQVPGNPAADIKRPLHRLYPDYDPQIYNDNHAEAVRTCKAWWGDDYSQGGQFECDEFPFRSTYQGASQANGNYSARVIDAIDNGTEGTMLGNWYQSHRILHDDPFYVALQPYLISAGGSDLPDTPPSVSAGPDVSGYEGSAITLRGAVRDLEETPGVQWSYEIVSAKKPQMSCSMTDADHAVARITCNDEGTVRVTLTANDGVNGPASDSATVTVLNAPPQLGSIGPAPWAVFKAHIPVTLTAPFTDPGVLDTHTCTVTWDDGTNDNYPAQNHTCDQQHTFDHAGMYTVTVTVTDDGGASDKATTMIVVYDPDAAFDNADGSIVSAPGAWTVQPDVGGQLDFHLTANYYGADKPTGTAKSYLANTTLRLDAGDKGLDWLVVTPDGKVAAKGTGTVNGQSGYGFVFYGYDGCSVNQTVQCQPGPDKFRMVLWPLSAGPNPGDDTLYDNRPDASYDVDVAQPQELHTGAVTIHPPTN